VLHDRYALPDTDQVTGTVWARASIGAIRTALGVLAGTRTAEGLPKGAFTDAIRVCFATLSGTWPPGPGEAPPTRVILGELRLGVLQAQNPEAASRRLPAYQLARRLFRSLLLELPGQHDLACGLAVSDRAQGAAGVSEPVGLDGRIGQHPGLPQAEQPGP
jgi:hypothetical protein